MLDHSSTGPESRGFRIITKKAIKGIIRETIQTQRWKGRELDFRRESAREGRTMHAPGLGRTRPGRVGSGRVRSGEEVTARVARPGLEFKKRGQRLAGLGGLAGESRVKTLDGCVGPPW